MWAKGICFWDSFVCLYMMGTQKCLIGACLYSMLETATWLHYWLCVCIFVRLSFVSVHFIWVRVYVCADFSGTSVTWSTMTSVVRPSTYLLEMQMHINLKSVVPSFIIKISCRQVIFTKRKLDIWYCKWLQLILALLGPKHLKHRSPHQSTAYKNILIPN